MDVHRCVGIAPAQYRIRLIGWLILFHFPFYAFAARKQRNLEQWGGMRLYAAHLDFDSIAEEFNIPTDFDDAVTEAAAQARDRFPSTRTDMRDLPLVTIDPQGSMDLEQPVFFDSLSGGCRYSVYYAIADVAAFLDPGGVIEEESLQLGQTIYLPDEPARLHPAELSEGEASLLPDVDRPAVAWTFHLDASGEVNSFHVERALVRSRARLDYDQAHQDLISGELHSSIALLTEVGKLRQASSLRRHAISLRLPSQRVVEGDDGQFELVIEPRHEIMDYNSEISLLTGMCAGQLMAEHGVGFLRTLPAATEESEQAFLQGVAALGYEVGEQSISEFLLSINSDDPRGMAAMRLAQKLLRGADYVWLCDDDPEIHAGIGGYYAHVTAPLRRLVDRFASEVCLALCAGEEIPAWVTDKADEVIATMRRTSQLASQVDKAVLNWVEAKVLQPWVGHNFEAIVLARDEEKDTASVFVADPPVLADVIGAPPQGRSVKVSLITANPDKREVKFAWPAD